MANLPTLAYATSGDAVYVNLYTSSQATLALADGRSVELQQETSYPWNGKIKVTVDTPGEYTLQLRIPGWCNENEVRLDGKPIPLPPRGYAQLKRQWKSGDEVTLELPMPIERVKSDPRVKANVGRVALRRGPVVYCVEAIDNRGKATSSAA
jgi:DUF1680 family protein